MSAAPPVDPPRVVLDACVLVPMGTREILFQIARRGGFHPLWSARIEGEWRATAIKLGAPGAAVVDGEIALARAAFPAARVEGWQAIEPTLSLPDWEDRHVLAAAIAGDAAMIVTDNLRDFPPRRLAVYGIARESADAFLWRLAGAAPDAVAAALESYRASAPADLISGGLRAHFKKLRLPRFAKLLAS